MPLTTRGEFPLFWIVSVAFGGGTDGDVAESQIAEQIDNLVGAGDSNEHKIIALSGCDQLADIDIPQVRQEIVQFAIVGSESVAQPVDDRADLGGAVGSLQRVGVGGAAQEPIFFQRAVEDGNLAGLRALLCVRNVVGYVNKRGCCQGGHKKRRHRQLRRE